MIIRKLNCRKRKLHLCEEHPSHWNSKNYDRGENSCKRWRKRKTNPLFNQDIDRFKGQDLIMDSSNKKTQVEKLALERFQNEDVQLWKENNNVLKNDVRVQWKTGIDITNNFQNFTNGSPNEKFPQLYERSNENEINIKTEPPPSNMERWSYKNLCEGKIKDDERTLSPLISKCHEIDQEKESLCIDHKKIEIQSSNSNKMFESLNNPILYSKNIGCIELMEPSSGWVYHTSYSTMSGIYTLEQLQKGLETNFLPEDLPIYRVHAGTYTGPFMLKRLIEKNDCLSACLIDQLEQPLVREQNMDYVRGLKSFLTSHKLNVTPFSYEPIPIVTNAWPYSMNGSFMIEQDPLFLKVGSPYQVTKLNNYSKLHSNEAQWRSSNRPCRAYQQSREWLDRDVFGFFNAPTRQHSLLENPRISPSCMYSNRHIEQPIMNLNSFGRTRYQSLHETYDKQHKQTEINRREGNNTIFQGQMWIEPLWEYEGADHSLKGPFSLWQLWQWYHIGHLYGCLKIFHIGSLIEPLPLEKLLIFANKGTLFEQSLPQNHSFSEHGGENSTCDSSLLKEPHMIALDFVQQKLHAIVLNAIACKGLLDMVITQILHEESSISKTPLILMKQSISPNKQQSTTSINDKSTLNATIINKVSSKTNILDNKKDNITLTPSKNKTIEDKEIEDQSKPPKQLLYGDEVPHLHIKEEPKNNSQLMSPQCQALSKKRRYIECEKNIEVNGNQGTRIKKNLFIGAQKSSIHKTSIDCKKFKIKGEYLDYRLSNLSDTNEIIACSMVLPYQQQRSPYKAIEKLDTKETQENATTCEVPKSKCKEVVCRDGQELCIEKGEKKVVNQNVSINWKKKNKDIPIYQKVWKTQKKL
jgi:hypothetical protein